MTQIYGNLLTMDANGKLHPGLASEWKGSNDAKTFTFNIPEVKCHDGSMFNAAAAKWNIDRVMDPATPVRYWGIEELQALLEDVGFDVHRHLMVDVLPYPHVLYIARRRP